MSKTTELGLPALGQIHHYVVAGDFHSEHVDEKSLNCLIQYGLTLKRKLPKNDDYALIINGDFLDVEHLMFKGGTFKGLYKAKAFEELSQLSLDEYMLGNSMLDRLQKAYPNIFFISGNHEVRAKEFLAHYECPIAYQHNFEIEKGLHLKKRGIPHYDYNDFLKIGNHLITHGIWCGASALNKHHAVAGGHNIIYNHVHNTESKSYANKDGVVHAHANGTMADLGPHYIKNRPVPWSNAFISLHVQPTGHGTVYNHEIVNGKLLLPTGEILG